ncbi:MAG TPA: ABC transporter ATP-binding protein [Spongiibacteraceae bacterium]|nr:ABC transporter ATP-binding protein [Spongiibacteraceae bacterium]
MSLLRIENLNVSVANGANAKTVQRWPVLQDVTLTMEEGETLGLVGESGSGKSVTALSILRLLPQPTLRVDSGAIVFDSREINTLSTAQMCALRGDRIAMIFQDPMTALNPVQTIGKQIEEVLLLHRPKWSGVQRRKRVLELLERVGMPAAEQRLQAYPHQLSGGMRQRVTIAMALACEPKLLIADEPTTALDVTVQAQVLNLIGELQQQSGMAVLFITHDLGVIAETCRNVAVMYAGRIVEQAAVTDLFAAPRHPYTRALLGSLPALSANPQQPLAAIPGQVPDIEQRPGGCAFANRCSYRTEICTQLPPLREVAVGHRSACFHADLLAANVAGGAQ